LGVTDLFVKVPTFNQAQPAVDDQGRFTAATLRTLNDAIQNIVKAINTLAQIPEIQAALETLDSTVTEAQAAISDAQTAISNVNAATAATTAATSLANSYVTGLTLSAADAGSSVTVTISAHTRIYGDGTSVSVNGGTITGLPYSSSTSNPTTEYIYYSDPTRAGGTVAYQATTSASTAAQVGDVHTVGSAIMPVAAAAPVTGSPVRPPGVGAIRDTR
jgi:hypothetical protein